MPTASLDGVSLQYVDRGSGSAILYIHGSGDFGDFFARTAAEMGPGFRTIAYDRRGFGRSSWTPAARLGEHVDDAADLLRHLDVRRATIVGSSAGGVIALALAIEHPDLVEALVLAEPTYQPALVPSASATAALIRMTVRRWLLRDAEGAAVGFYRWVTAYSTGGNQFDSYPEAWKRAGARHARAAMREVRQLLVPPWPPGRALRSISCPVTFVTGDFGQPFFRRTTDRARRFLEGARLVRVSGSAHLLATDRPAALAGVVRAVASGQARQEGEKGGDHVRRRAAAPVVHVMERTSAAPEQVLQAARDFSERRAELWPDVHLEHFEVHRRGDTSADVTEGNPEPFGYIWERLRYDWSQPGSLRATVTDSNIFKPGSSWEIKAAPCNGGSQVEIVGVRDVKGLKGAVIGGLIRTGIAERIVAGQLRHFLSKVEEASP